MRVKGLKRLVRVPKIFRAGFGYTELPLIGSKSAQLLFAEGEQQVLINQKVTIMVEDGEDKSELEMIKYVEKRMLIL